MDGNMAAHVRQLVDRPHKRGLLPTRLKSFSSLCPRLMSHPDNLSGSPAASASPALWRFRVGHAWLRNCRPRNALGTRRQARRFDLLDANETTWALTAERCDGCAMNPQARRLTRRRHSPECAFDLVEHALLAIGDRHSSNPSGTRVM